MRDRELVQRVKDATDLAALVGQAVKLRRQGSAWIGLCPFHSERSPSFQVVGDRGFYHCFGCGKHGDALTWLMEREGCTFGEALEHLAGAAGIELPKARERSSVEIDLEVRLRAALEGAQAFFQSRLLETPRALDYLKGRGMASAFLQEAGLGYAPEGWENLVSHLRRAGFSPELLEQAGLISRSERGTPIDFLRERLTIPIHDARGRLIAFGGRAFGEAKPKYLNTRETSLFSKGQVLFGFHRAKGHLKDGALIVEGYFDVLQLHQEWVNAAVAPLGTALTEQHLQLLGRFTKKLTLCFDGDAAGIRAMEKALRLALPQGFDLRLLLLPEGEDPDTWCMKLGAEAFRELLRNAPDWTSFVIGRALEGKDTRRIPDRMAALRELAEYLVFLPPTAERRELFASLAHQLQIPFPEFERAVKARATRAGEMADTPAWTPPPVDEVEEVVKTLVLLARTGHGSEVASWPSAWWEGLGGAPLLQAQLDSEGDDDLLPSEVLKQIRSMEARISRRDQLEVTMNLQETRLKLELSFVDREMQCLVRQLQEPVVMADGVLLHQVQRRLEELRRRRSDLARQQRLSRTASLA